jgi:translation initiation factor eIF-2B subunit delta
VKADVQQKAALIESIGHYVRDRIEYADQLITESAMEKINPGDTVVTYARYVWLSAPHTLTTLISLMQTDPRSSIVERVLIEAWRKMKAQNPEATFEVVVVDSRPLNEGKQSSPYLPLTTHTQAETCSSRSPNPVSHAPTSSSLNLLQFSNAPL